MKTLPVLFIYVASFFAFSVAQAQSPAPKTKYLNAGIGIGAYTAGGIPIGVSFEMVVKDNISVGGFFDYAHYGYKYGDYKANYNFLYFGARGSYHLKQLLQELDITNDKLEPYAGLSLGFRTASYNDNFGNDFTSPYSSGVFLGIHGGTRYMFSEKIGAFTEVGYGVSALRLGVTAKF